MIVLDANVVIAYLGAADAHSEKALEVLDTEEPLILHPVTLAECLVGAVARGVEAAVLGDLARLGIEQHTPRPDEALRAARLRAETRLKLPDAYVLTTALKLGAALATFDGRIATAATERDIEVVGL